MITGIIITALFAVVCLRGLEKRLKPKRRGFAKIHTAAGIALVAVAILHIVLTFPLLRTRPVSVLISGMLCLSCILACFVSGLRKQFKAHRLLALCACVFIVLHVVFDITAFIDYKNQVKNISIHNVGISQIADGVYTGECDVTFIYAKVAVTVRSGEIVDVAILEHRNERGGAAERIAVDVLKQQSLAVDAVSGATNSSVVIKKAIENALAP